MAAGADAVHIFHLPFRPVCPGYHRGKRINSGGGCRIKVTADAQQQLFLIERKEIATRRRQGVIPPVDGGTGYVPPVQLQEDMFGDISQQGGGRVDTQERKPGCVNADQVPELFPEAGDKRIRAEGCLFSPVLAGRLRSRAGSAVISFLLCGHMWFAVCSSWCRVHRRPRRRWGR